VNLKVLRYEVQGVVAVVTMNHQPMNALGVRFLDEFESVLEKIGRADIHAVVITSACPGFFSAGYDVTLLKNIGDDHFDNLPRVHTFLNAIESLPVPTVAAINGRAFGGGLELALTCDFRFMGDASGRIGLTEIRLGLLPSFGGTQRLPRVVGKAKAIEMMFNGLMIKPEEAARIGLVTAVFPQSEVLEKSIAYAAGFSRRSAGALARIKECVNVGLREGFERGIEAEQEACRKNLVTPDAREGIAAYLEGRRADFNSRDRR